MSKKIKLAIIRSDTLRQCPFNLPIPEACGNAGDAVHRMAPLKVVKNNDQQKRLKRANALVYIQHKTGSRCPFADKVLEKYKKTDCDFGDTGQGQRSVPYRGSPLYPSTFGGIGLNGIYGFPLGLYSGNDESRNLFFGLFSYLGSEKPKELIKLADKYDKNDEREKADIIDEILDTIMYARSRDELEEKLQDIEDFLRKYKEEYEKGSMDPGLIWKSIQR